MKPKAIVRIGIDIGMTVLLLSLMAYELIGSSGPDHNKTFSMRVLVAGETAGTGEGRTKQEAGQQAARAALVEFGVIHEAD